MNDDTNNIPLAEVAPPTDTAPESVAPIDSSPEAMASTGSVPDGFAVETSPLPSPDAAEEAALQIDERELTRQALWERKLLDFSLRNNLLNTRLGKRAMQFVTFDVPHLEDQLQSGENYTILPWPEKRKKVEAADGLFHTTEQAADLHDAYDADLKAHKLSTYLSATELKPVLTALYRGARTALEENGANSLFVAIGMLKWYVTEKSDQPRYAPILLLPVNIVRNGGGYIVRLRDEETILNVTLNEFLRQQFKLLIPTFDPLPRDANGVDVPAIFATMRKAIAQHKRWEIIEESVLGLFSFNKFVMWNDIHTNAALLQQSPVVQSLVERRLTLDESGKSVDVREFDLTATPADVATPISVDSSQLEAVIESGEGKSFILYGPPGTGKSQTITNMIANALYQGRRVLFVAEKMAALSVVQKRLEKIGLGPFCLELHSNKVTKSHFLQQLNEALEVTHGHVSEDFQKRSEELFATRQQLNTYMQAVHTKGHSGLSVYDCIEGYLSLGSVSGGLPAGLSDLAATKTATDLTELTDTLTQLDAVFQVTGHPHGHPLQGLYLRDDRRDTLSATETLLRQLQASGLQPATLNAEWKTITDKWFLPRYFATKTFLKRLQVMQPALTKSGISDLLTQITPYADTARIPQWLEAKDGWREWYQWSSRRDVLVAQGWQVAVDAIREQGMSGAETAKVIARELYKEWAERMIDDNELLRQFSGLVFEDVIARYRQMTEHFQELTKKELYCRLAARIPAMSIEAVTSSEAGILKRNIANGGRGTSIRHIIDQIPTLLPKLCPCMLMSPISVAQFIDLEQPKFDLVIFDEASQMPTSEAVGAIGRGKALIVVGDNKQMPPTSFFATQQVDDEDAEMDDLDSILDDCKALSLPDHYLAFHYRSKHESLIAFSNEQYYDSRLFTFPSSDDRVSKVSIQYVEGTYDKGGQRSNRAEAEAVVAEIIRRLADDELSKRSIGVVAFSVAQQNLIEDVLMEVISGKPEMEARAFQCDEPIFIKNLENVQGDERDVILFSIGYGPDKNGNVSLNFGPLNNRGGERRLNVAVSRARYEMRVFSTLHPEQIDLRRTKALGVEGLYKFLKYAEGTRNIEAPSVDSASANSVSGGLAAGAAASLPASIAAALSSLGYATTTAVGRSKFKIDVAVVDPKDPERYILAILVDGHSRAETKIARDRELTQPSVLQGLGWRVLRVFSVDWMRNRQRVIDTIVKAIEEARAGIKPAEAKPLQLAEPKIVANRQPAQPARPAALRSNSDTKVDITDLKPAVIDREIMKIVNELVALPFDELLRVTTKQLGYARRSQRMDAVITRRIASLIVEKQIMRDGDTIKLP